MRICIPTQTDAGLRAPLAPHYGKAPFFTFVELDTGEVAVHTNAAGPTDPDACHHCDLLRDQKVAAVVGAGMGQRALQGLRRAGIEVLTQKGPLAADAVAAVRLGMAVPMTAPHACTGRGCLHDFREAAADG